MKVAALVLALCATLQWACAVASTPRVVTIDSCVYADDASAQAAWAPGVPSPQVRADPNGGVILPCPFSQKMERVAWDRKLSLDLSACDRFRLQMRATNPGAVGFCTIYFHSGNGWYGANFPLSSRTWQTITLSRAEFIPEGAPAGWDHVDTIRISPWRGDDLDATLTVRGISGIVDGLVVVTGDALLPPNHPEAASVREFARTMDRMLSRFGLEHGAIDGRDVQAGGLRGRRIAIFPYNPDIDDAEAAQVASFVAAGGRIIACYTVQQRMADILGIQYVRHSVQDHPGQYARIRWVGRTPVGCPREVLQASWNISVVRPVPGKAQTVAVWYDANGRSTDEPAITRAAAGYFISHVLLGDDPDRKAAMLLAMLGALDPSVWPAAASRAVDDVGRLSPRLPTFDAAANRVRLAARKGAGGRAALQDLERARQLRVAARRQVSARRWPEALASATQANQLLSRAVLRSIQPRKGEFRAVWCHSAFGIEGWDWDKACRTLAAHGFTAILPNMLWGGIAYYKSAVLPVAPEVATRGDQIAQCVAAAKKYGLKVYVWKVNWNLLTAPKEFIERMRAEGRTQVDRRGQPVDWLCPSSPENQRMERESMLEVVRNYAVDGIHFDYIRYPDGDSCYCHRCRQQFEDATGVKAEHWPDDVISGPRSREFKEWRCEQITRLVADVSQEARRIRPGIQVSAAVFPDYPNCRDSVGQDWLQWIRNGYLDFVCPMDYTEYADHLEAMVTRQLRFVDSRVPLYPGIGATSPERLTPLAVADQIETARKCGAKGFVLFNYDAGVAKDILPMLSLGATRPSPFGARRAP